MINPDSPKNVNVDELLAGRALGDLSEQELAQLESLSANGPGHDSSEFEYVLAALSAGSVSRDELPPALRETVRRQAPAYLPRGNSEPAMSRRFSGREILAWFVTTVCAVLLLVRSLPRDVVDPPSIGDQRAALLERASDVVEIAWGPGLHPFEQDVAGEVVWSNSLQQGFLRFVNMPVNDPDVEQYQLWIIDPQRDDEPIDGGVFDISGSGEVLVPIDAKLAVISPQAFAVTIEKPGGVVVSTQDRLPLLARVDL